MKEITGNLITLAQNRHFDVIIHGCNCQCVMGAGLAKSIKIEFPQAFEADLATAKGDRNKLGTISTATVDINGHEINIINAYTQFHWRGTGVKADYNAIRKCFTEVKNNFSGKRIGYPLIGAGLAGGDWSIISKIIRAKLEGEDHTLVKFQL